MSLKLLNEITHVVERLELLEEKFDITISGLYANVTTESGLYYVTINFDLTSLSDDKLERGFKVVASAYNSAGQLLSTHSNYINADNFMGFSPVSFFFGVDQVPEKIRLFPAAV